MESIIGKETVSWFLELTITTTYLVFTTTSPAPLLLSPPCPQVTQLRETSPSELLKLQS